MFSSHATFRFRTLKSSFKTSFSSQLTIATWSVKSSRSCTISQTLTLRRSTNTGSSYHEILVCNHLRNKNPDEARRVFDKIRFQDVRLYTKMINGYVQSHRLNDALKLFDEMAVRDTVCWNSMIKGCLDCGDMKMADLLFNEMPERTLVSWTTMIDGSFRFGAVGVAERLFKEMPVKDMAAWNVMIHGYCCNGRVEDAMDLFKQIHPRNVVSWTSMIGGLDQNGKSKEALFLLREMIGSGVVPNSSTLVCALSACVNYSDFSLGLQIHSRTVKSGLCHDEFIRASLVSFYANLLHMAKACKVFSEVQSKNVVIHTSLLTGFAVNGKHEYALKAFEDMIRMGVLPNESSFTSTLNSCCALESVDTGKEVHAVAIKLKLGNDVFTGNSLIVMYTRCGMVDDAISVFGKLGEKNIVTWNATLAGCAQNGRGKWALSLFNKMLREGIESDEITHMGLLSACNHTGMLQKGKGLFKYFTSQISPVKVKQEHYACMVDLLGRWGKLDDAEDLVRNMPMEPNAVVWLALLSAGRMHSNIDVAERAATCVLKIDPNCSAAYVLLSNAYASGNKWPDVARLRVIMKERGVVKQRGCSWLTLKGQRHTFLSGDKSHPLSEKIYQKLEWLRQKLKELGYVPDKKFDLHDVEDEQKEESLFCHSERLAIAFGLISTVEGSTITVMKNLRICGDCHLAIKLIAKVVEREIVVRDSSRFHHFRDGFCSCCDYW